MVVTKNANADSLTIAVSGRLDTTTAPELEKQIDYSGVKNLTFDFKDLEYISSAGLRVILAAQKVMNKQGKMTVINVNETVMEVFEITGFLDIINVQ